MSSQPDLSYHLADCQALIGDPLASDLNVPKKWWALVRVAVLWFIWIAHNDGTIAHKNVSHRAMKVRIWHRIKLVLQSEWSKCLKKQETGALSESRVRYLFKFDFGQCDKVFKF